MLNSTFDAIALTETMHLSLYEPNPQRYDDIFGHIQGGGNPMVRYRGSSYQNGSGFPQILKALFAKLASFAQPVLRAAAPHARKAFAAAQPHLKEAAMNAVRDMADRGAEAIAKRFEPTQEGQGLKRKRLTHNKAKKVRRIPPRDLPDFI